MLHLLGVGVTTHFVLVGVTSSKSLKLRRFKPDRDEIWQDCSASEYASIDGVRFRIRRHTFKKVAMKSFCEKA